MPLLHVQMLHIDPILVKLEISAHHRARVVIKKKIICLLGMGGLLHNGGFELFISVVTLKALGF